MSKKISKIVLNILLIVTMLFLINSCNNKTNYVPTIGIKENNIVFWNQIKEENISYNVYVNNELYINTKEVELLPFDANGTYSIYVKTVIDGKEFEQRSSIISYTINADSTIISPICTEFDYFKHYEIGNVIYVVDIANKKSDEILLLESIQALAIKKNIGIYLSQNNNIDEIKGYVTINKTIEEIYSILHDKKIITSYIISNIQNINEAKTLCGISNSIIVTSDTLKYITNDLKIYDDYSIIENNDNLNKNIIVYSNNYDCYTDLGLINNCLFTNNIDNFNSFDFVIGYDNLYSINNKHYNLSLLSNISKITRNTVYSSSLDTNTHFVTLVTNNDVDLNLISNNKEYNLFDISLTSSLINIDDTKDYYMISDLFKNTSYNLVENKQSYMSMINNLMGKVCSSYVSIKDSDIDSINTLGYLSNISGGFVLNNNNITWVNNKPFISYVGILDNENGLVLASKINNSSKDINNIDAYSAIYVNINTTQEKIEEFLGYLSNDNKILNADEFVKTINNNVSKINSVINLSSDTSNNISLEHNEYNMYGLKYSKSTNSLYFLFTNSLSGFNSYTSRNTSIKINDGIVEMTYDKSDGKNYMYQRIKLPNWDKIYLNLQLLSKDSSPVRILLYLPNSDSFVNLFENNVKAWMLEDYSFDLTSINNIVFEEEIVLIIDQNAEENTKHVLKVDNISFNKTKTREDVEDSNVYRIEKTTSIDFNKDEYYTIGNVANNNGLVLSSNNKTVYDDALASMAMRIRLQYDNKNSYSLSFDLTNVVNALYRVRIVDGNKINNIIIPWTYINSECHISCDLSNYTAQNIIIYIELSNKEYSTSSYNLQNLKINKNEGKYYYQIGNKETFQGTSNVWNLEGWVINEQVSYGDLTSEPGYGSLRLDGSNSGIYDENSVIGQAYKSYQLTTNNVLSFDARSGGPTNATFIRVRVVKEDGTSVILNQDTSNNMGWFLVKGEGWKKYDFDLSSFNNQKVTIYLEQTDHGTGIGEIAFIDSLIIK